jgi:hypothetical protein
MVTKKQKAEAVFNDLVNDGAGTPEEFVLKVMRGKVAPSGRLTKAMRWRFDAALALLPYRLPRLNSIDATNRNVTQSHEEWLKSMEGEDDDGQA